MKPELRKSSPRGSRDGNILWAAYKALGHEDAKSFRDALKSFSIDYTAFLRDSQKSRDLSRLPLKRIKFYAQYFRTRELLSIFSDTRTAVKSQNDDIQIIAERQKLSKKK